MAAISNQAQTGFAKADSYDTYRPTYSASATQTLVQKLGLAGKANAKILDLASGTGKFTDALVARDENFSVVAVEPHDGMRDVLAKKKHPNVEVLSGTAEKIPLPDASVDAIIVAQAFHWFATDVVLKELHRVGRRHSSLGLIWNIDDYNAPRSYKPKTAWEQKAHDLIWTFDDTQSRFRHEQWRKVFDDQLKTTPLSLIKANDQYFSLPLGQEMESYQVWLSKDKVWERYSTLSQIAILEGKERERTYQTFMDALNAADVETNEKGEIALHGNTYIVWTTKIPDEGRENLTTIG